MLMEPPAKEISKAGNLGCGSAAPEGEGWKEWGGRAQLKTSSLATSSYKEAV